MYAMANSPKRQSGQPTPRASSNVRAFPDDVNVVLRELARELVETRYGDIQIRFAEAMGISGSYVSDFLAEKRGAGLTVLRGLGRVAPLQLLQILGIDPRTLLTLLQAGSTMAGQPEGKQMKSGLPDALERARDTAVILLRAAPDDAHRVALELARDHGEDWTEDPELWLLEMRKRLPQAASRVVPAGRRRRR